MAFKKLPTMDTDSTITIGGVEKKTGKKNPTSVEGYFLGTKALGPNKFNKSKTDYMHVFQTKDGNVGVWGKTHMDRQLVSVTPGTMTRVSFAGTKDVGKGNDMTCYLVEVDELNTIHVNFDVNASREEDSGEADYSNDYDGEEESADDKESAADEVAPSRPVPPRQAAQAPSAASIAKTKALLGGSKNKVA